MAEHRVIAIIPARGGSKRIPRKNLALLRAVPLLDWVVRAAHAAHLVRVLVSTEDAVIATRANWLGAEVVPRPPELAEDAVPDLPVLQHAVQTTDEAHSDVVVVLRPTGPFVTPALIHEALALLHAHPWADAVRSIRPVREHPYKMVYAVLAGHDNVHVLRPVLDDPRHRTLGGAVAAQGLAPVWIGAGVVRAIRTNVLVAGSMEGTYCLGLRVPSDVAVDIDGPADLARAERIAEAHQWCPCGD